MDSGYPHRQDIEILRREMPPLAAGPAHHYLNFGESKAIYISRVKSERSPANEIEFVERLRRETEIYVIEAESMSFLGQVSLFGTAKAVIGVHGAGLTNQVWMKPGSKVLELFDRSYSNPVFASLAKVCGHAHEAVPMRVDSKDGTMIDIDDLFSKIKALS
jgi:capsular polysaccharide biosynthesis protein